MQRKGGDEGGKRGAFQCLFLLLMLKSFVTVIPKHWLFASHEIVCTDVTNPVDGRLLLPSPLDYS